jgi:hypothetical protein
MTRSPRPLTDKQRRILDLLRAYLMAAGNQEISTGNLVALVMTLPVGKPTTPGTERSRLAALRDRGFLADRWQGNRHFWRLGSLCEPPVIP